MRRILFVNAPFGPFFRDLVAALESTGCQVFRTVSDGGEFMSTPARCRIRFSERESDWEGFVDRIISARRIDGVVTFNDTLPRTRSALAVAKRLKIQRYVLENGYLRPFWVTFDRNGVNGHSALPADPDFYLGQSGPIPAHDVFESRMRFHIINAISHFAWSVALAPVLPFDPNTFGDSIWKQATMYSREWMWRKTHSENGILAEIDRRRARGRKIYLMLTQKPGDAQLTVHSRFTGNNDHLRETLASFAKFAPADVDFVIKQHPLDYGIERTPRFVEKLAAEFGLTGRVHFLRKTSFEAALSRANAVVTVNSTAGLVAIERGLPTICLGRAVYDMQDLTFQDGLDAFWSRPTAPRPEVAQAFLSYLKRTSQFNGGFHAKAGRALLTPKLAQALADDALVHYGAKAPAAGAKSRPLEWADWMIPARP